MKKILMTSVLILILLGVSYFVYSISSPNQVCRFLQCVEVEVVHSQQDRSKGLQNRAKLEENRGMLFIFDEQKRYNFWMKDTLIPLDIVWIDFARRVVDIRENVPPCEADPCPVYSPQADALYVLEVNGHHAKKMGIKKGDVLNFNIKEM